jgi:hypothetical protein
MVAASEAVNIVYVGILRGINEDMVQPEWLPVTKVNK